MLKKPYIPFLLILLSLGACRYTRHVPDGQRLLIENKIKVKDNKKAPAAANNILKQQPNSDFRLWGIYLAPSLGLYSLGNGKEDHFFSKIGSAPVLVDSVLTGRGAQQLQAWYFNHGYFKARTSYDIQTFKRNPKKARIQYFVTTGEQYSIDEYKLKSPQRHLASLAHSYKDEQLIGPGDTYDADLLDKERSRLAQIFRNHGYYGFNKNYIVFEADTFKEGRLVDIEMFINPRTEKKEDTTVSRNHGRHYIQEVIIIPDRNFGTGSQLNDTTEFLSYKLVYDSLPYRPRYLTDAIHFGPGDRYDERKVRETYTHLASYRTFRVIEINFKELKRHGKDSITLQAVVNLTPETKRTITFEPELTNTSGNLGVRASASWVNRNLFRGGEILEIRPSTGLEYQPTPGSDQLSETFELGGEVRVRFPRFLLPFNTVGLLPKRMQPRSQISLSVSRLDRVEFERVTLRSQLGYSWNESIRKTHEIKLVDLSYSRLPRVSNAFLNNLNPIQQRAFRSELISAMSHTFTYNEQADRRATNYRFFRSGVELAGPILTGLVQSLDVGVPNESGNREILEVQYFPYVKLELDGRYYWNLNRKRAWVNRVFAGYIFPWGNSVLDTDSGQVRIPPFSRYFFMGGNNDLRGWNSYRLGPGRTSNTDYLRGRDTAFATGTFKLLFNSEYRFPLVSSLKGAVFVDAGNIWNTGGLETPNTGLTWDALYRELAIGTGLGLRLDLDYFVIRFDVGVKVRDPGRLDLNDEWVIISQPVLPNLSYHIALGYPF